MKNIHHPPKLGEQIISLLLTDENADEILGDFAELFNAQIHQDNFRNAQFWYFGQIFRSAPSLLQIKLSHMLERSYEFMSTNTNAHNKRSLWISLIAVIPALTLVIPGILQSGFGYLGANEARDAVFASVPALEVLINPVILMGGLFLAFVMNILPAIKFRFERNPEGLTSTITFKPVLLHWVFIGASILMVAVIFTYAIIENFGPIFN